MNTRCAGYDLDQHFLNFFAPILTPDPSPPVERGGSSLPFSAREKGKG